MRLAPSLPPLLRGEAVPSTADPFERAVAAARNGADPGLITYAEDDRAVRAAAVFAPQMPLADAMGALLAVELGIADAIGALAPPEVAVHMVWPDKMTVNGALCPVLRVAASTTDPDGEPDWLVIGFTIPVASRGDRAGETPGVTTLADEGCADIDPATLIESASRHMLVWIHTLVDEGLGPIARAWSAKARDAGGVIDVPVPGTVLGLGERGELVVRRADGATDLLPLTLVLDPEWPNSRA